MQLCDKDILVAIKDGDLVFAGTNPAYPFKKEQVQPASIDLRLGNRIIRFKKELRIFDIKNIKSIDQYLDVEYVEDGHHIIIEPGEILFGQIYEQIVIGDCFSARIEGRSRVARLGISVHCTGDYINPGFAGAMPLQIINHNHFPVLLYPYIGICQMIVYRLTDTPLVSYLQRSVLPYNVYYNETNPSPSILSANPTEGLTNETIIERKIHSLIENYYHTKSQEGNSIISGLNDKAVVQNATIQNLIMGGYSNMRDQYNAHQAGIQGPNSGNKATVFQSLYEEKDVDESQLCLELEKVKEYLKKQSQNDDNDILIGDITRASWSLSNHKNDDARMSLKTCGNKLYDIAKTIGCGVLAQYLAKLLGC